MTTTPYLMPRQGTLYLATFRQGTSLLSPGSLTPPPPKISPSRYLLG